MDFKILVKKIHKPSWHLDPVQLEGQMHLASPFTAMHSPPFQQPPSHATVKDQTFWGQLSIYLMLSKSVTSFFHTSFPKLQSHSLKIKITIVRVRDYCRTNQNTFFTIFSTKPWRTSALSRSETFTPVLTLWLTVSWNKQLLLHSNFFRI